MKKTSKIANTKEELIAIQELKIDSDGVSIEYDKDRKLHIHEDESDKLIDKILDDVHGTTYVSSVGIAKMFDLRHDNLINDTIKKMFKRKRCCVLNVVNSEIQPLAFDAREEYNKKVESGFDNKDAIEQVKKMESKRPSKKKKSSPAPAGLLQTNNIDEKPWFVKTTYVAENGKTNPQYLVSSDAFIYLCLALPKPKRLDVREMREDLMIKVIERMRHYQTLLTLNFQDYITDIRQLGKTSRRCLTDAIKWKIESTSLLKTKEMTKKTSKEIGKIYGFITSTIYHSLYIPESFHKGNKDKFPNDVLFLIHVAESIAASYISTMQVSGQFNLEFMISKRRDLELSLLRHIEGDKVNEMVATHFNNQY